MSERDPDKTDRPEAEIPLAELTPVLHAMGCARGAAISIMTTSAIHSATYREALALRERIDALAGLLTGDEFYFWPDGHATKG